MQDIQNFCTIHLGGYYLDIIKDRLYTSKQNGIARRSCQTSLDYLLNILVRLIAPILSYTAEEIWQSSERLNNQEESIFLSNYDLSEINEESIITKSDWNRIFEIKNDVNQSIEEMRNENQLKGSLDANVYIEANKNDIKILEKLGAELHFLFICSETNIIENNNFKITVKSLSNQKCTRCWHRHESVGTSKKHPDLCNRCIENVDGEGEKRSFV